MEDFFINHSPIILVGIAHNISAHESAGVKCQLSTFITENQVVNNVQENLAIVISDIPQASTSTKEVVFEDVATQYRLQGIFDNTNLFGKFDIVGRIVSTSHNNPISCFQFIGELVISSPKSGFKRNTKTSFVITLSVSSAGAKGIYHIGELPSFDFHQYGTLDLYFEKYNPFF